MRDEDNGLADVGELVPVGHVSITNGFTPQKVILKFADGSERILWPGETVEIVSVPGGVMPLWKAS